MSDEQKTVKELANNIESTYADLKTELDSVKGKVDSIDEKKHDAMIEDILQKCEELQKQQSALEAKAQRHEMAAAEGHDFSDHKTAFVEWMRDKSSRKEIDIIGQSEFHTKSMSTDVNPDGGYLVRPELANFVVDRVFETSPLRQVARVVTTGAKSIEVLIDDNEAAARWIGEGASGGETNTPEIGQKEITAHKLEADPRITIEQLQDSYLDVEGWLQEKVADKFARTENAAFVTGDGVAKPRGFTTYAAASDANVYERDAIGQFNLGATSFDATSADGLVEMQSLLKEMYQPNAIWGMNRTSYGKIMKIRGNDNYFFGNTFLKDGQQVPTLLGKRVVFMDDIAEEGSAALAVVYADFSVAYTIVDRVGLSVLRDPYTNKGFVTYYTTKRTGGDVTNFDAIKLGKLSS